MQALAQRKIRQISSSVAVLELLLCEEPAEIKDYVSCLRKLGVIINILLSDKFDSQKNHSLMIRANKESPRDIVYVPFSWNKSFTPNTTEAVIAIGKDSGLSHEKSTCYYCGRNSENMIQGVCLICFRGDSG